MLLHLAYYGRKCGFIYTVCYEKSKWHYGFSKTKPFSEKSDLSVILVLGSMLAKKKAEGNYQYLGKLWAFGLWTSV